MRTTNIRKITISAMLMALLIIFGRVFLIPIPWTHGNVNLCDAAVFLASLLFGRWYGGTVGGFGALLLDLISGYASFAPFSFLAHGLEGFLAGWLYTRTHNRFLALGVGIVVMVAVYVVANGVLYTWVAGILGIGTDLLQGIIGAVVAALVYQPLKRWENNE